MIEIIVFGTPAPQGSKKFVGIAKSTGRGIMVESSKKVKPWRQDVKAAALAAKGLAGPLQGALRCEMVFTLPKPSSAPKTRVTYPMRKPDLSKLVRSTEDALTDAGVWVDDAQVVDYAGCGKRFPNEGKDALRSPGVVIRIYPLEVQAAAQPTLPGMPTVEDAIEEASVPF